MRIRGRWPWQTLAASRGTRSSPAQTGFHYLAQRVASTNQLNLISCTYLDSQPKNSSRDSAFSGRPDGTLDALILTTLSWKGIQHRWAEQGE